MSVGGSIKRYRTERGITVQKLAELVQVPAPDIFMWEKDRLTPTVEQAASLAHALGVTVAEILGSEPLRADPPRDQDAGDSLDVALMARALANVRAHARSASAVDLATARTMIGECLAVLNEAVGGER